MMPLTTVYGELDEAMDILERAITEEFSARKPEAPKAPATHFVPMKEAA
jgi:hypothetical protein